MSIDEKKLLKIINPNRFRFIVIVYSDKKQINSLKTYIKKRFYAYPNMQYSIETVASAKSGFLYINDLDKFLKDEKESKYINFYRDRIAKSPINIIAFCPVTKHLDLHRRANNTIPDFWEFRSPFVFI